MNAPAVEPTRCITAGKQAYADSLGVAVDVAFKRMTVREYRAVIAAIGAASEQAFIEAKEMFR